MLGDYGPTPSRVKAWLDRLTYAPGYRWTVVAGRFGNTAAIHFDVRVIDARGPHRGHPGKVASVVEVPLGIESEDEFRRWLHRTLQELACHEVGEWLQDAATGEPLFDPHARAS